MAENLIYLTELQGLKIFDLEKRCIGRVRDVVLVPRLHPLRIDRFLIGEGYTYLAVRYDQVASISAEGMYLRDEHLLPSREDESVWRLGRDLLDKQIVDIHGRKVVRVSDITFRIGREDGHEALYVLEVDIGFRAILRRVLQGVVRPQVIRKLQSRIGPRSIPWEYCNIIEPDEMRRLRLNISLDKLADIHPAELADIVEDLPPAQREAIFQAIDSEAAADALSEVDPDMRTNILEALETNKAADIVEEMSPDEAADALANLEEATSLEILAEMESEPKEEVSQLLEFKHDTAGGLMNTEFVSVEEGATVRQALAAIRENADYAETLTSVFLLGADGKLRGVVPIGALVLANQDTPIKELASESLVQVPVTEDQDRIIETFDKYNLMVLPVVEDDQTLVGVITADDVITVLRHP